MKQLLVLLTMTMGLVAPTAAFGQSTAICDMSDEEIRGVMLAANEELAAEGWNIAVEEIECFTIGQGRPPVRIHQMPFRWVSNDPRRAAQGDDITYIVDQSGGATASGLTSPQTEAAIDSAMSTWDSDRSTKKMDIAKRADPGSDITVFFDLLGVGAPCADGFGYPFAADIVHAGWLPSACFAFTTLGFSTSAIFVDGGGMPTDINGDQYLDTALNEVYYNDAWGNPGVPDGRKNFPWNVGGLSPPNIDVETVALHESGHSLGLGHFGAPPTALMNSSYFGPQLTPLPIDRAGMFIVWGSWPNP